MELVLPGIIIDSEFQPVWGNLVIRDGILHRIEQERIKHPMGIICPGFVNAHLHLGDSISKDPCYLDLERLVGRGGFKFKLLELAPRNSWIQIRSSLRFMISSGITSCGDFRESGISGIELVNRASLYLPLDLRIFGRPACSELDFLEHCHGVGIPSIDSYDQDTLESIISRARSLGKLVGIHAGESSYLDIEPALSYDPDFLVHLTQARDSDLKLVADSGIPVIVCPSSNLISGIGSIPDRPPISKMLDYGIRLGLGTDNVMLNPPDILQELKFLSRYLRRDVESLKMACFHGAWILGYRDRGLIQEGMIADLVVLDHASENLRGIIDPISGIVRRASAQDIKLVIKEGKIAWRR